MALKILAPVSNLEDIRALARAGADEFYAGLMTQDVIEKYTNVFSLNLRNVAAANFQSYREMEKAVKVSHERGKPFHAAFNAHYLDDQVPVVLEQIERLLRMKVDALIVGDIGLFTTLRREFPEAVLHASTTAGTLNAETARLFEERGAHRVILPRGLTVPEIRRLQEGFSRIRFEIFILSERCLFTNAHCQWEHSQYEAQQGPVHRAWQGVKRWLPLEEPAADQTMTRKLTGLVQEQMIRRYGPPCFAEYEAELYDEHGPVRVKKPFLLQGPFQAFRDACGVCAVYDLNEMENVSTLKIVGRNHPTAKKVKDTVLLHEVLGLLKKGPDRETFRRETRKIRERHYPGMCEEAFCYYPDPVPGKAWNS